jgi:hypothetical protein
MTDDAPDLSTGPKRTRAAEEALARWNERRGKFDGWYVPGAERALAQAASLGILTVHDRAAFAAVIEALGVAAVGAFVETVYGPEVKPQ